ncbi:M56 family metallopeptidase [Micromonospora sp. B11E3]|uniref:M56 family metallopeptidase n=1 Tax=Micromonospora sp. B11E3 TaxID=3153562 RepID=UPI00325E3490
MSAALALIIGALVVAWLAPTLLEAAVDRVRDPIAVLLAWWVTLAAVPATLAVGVAFLLTPDTGVEDWARNLMHHCWFALQHGRLPAAGEIVGIVGVAALGASIARALLTVRRRMRAQRETQQAHLDLLTLLGGTAPTREAVLRIPHPAPLAYSLGGRQAMIIVSDGVLQLPPQQREAVLCHERAHVNGRHHLIVAAAEVLAAAAPWVPLARRSPRAIQLLVELRADDKTVRVCGAPAVRDALIALGGMPQPAHALPMAGSNLAVRLGRLQDGGVHHPRMGRAVLPLMAAAAPAVVAAVVAVTICV